MWWVLYGYYVMCGGLNSTEGDMVYKASLRICYVSLFECTGASVLKLIA